MGASLDVFKNEPLVNSELWEMENLIITPHNSFVSDMNSKRLFDLIVNNLEGYREKCFENTSNITKK